jgi:signal transduction histidine kinase
MAQAPTARSRQINNLARLVEVSVTLNSTLDIDLLLQHIVETACALLDVEMASILLVDELEQELRYAASTSSDPVALSKIPIALDSSLAGRIFRENKALNLDDLAGAPGHIGRVAEVTRLTPRALLGVPMRIRKKTIGVLEALNKRNGGFSADDQHTLSVLGSLAAVAIHNARLVAELQVAYAELGRLDRMKSDFIALASHELRTPLGVILGYAAILREESKGQAGEYARGVLESAVHMRNLIDDMTNMRYLEMGQLHLTREHLDLRQVLKEAYADLRPLAEAKAQTLAVALGQAPVMVYVDRNKMLLVASNLLTNAIRFTPAGGRVRVRLFVKGAEAWVQVQDTGAGIPPGQLESVFDRFRQIESHMTRRHSGLGLGLSIVRGIVELHGGRVWAESEGAGRGATFNLALPLSEKKSAAAFTTT